MRNKSKESEEFYLKYLINVLTGQDDNREFVFNHQTNDNDAQIENARRENNIENLRVYNSIG